MSDVNLQGSFGGQGGSSLMFRNKLINGNFAVWQRGTSFGDSPAYTYTADRWLADGSVTSVNSTGTQNDVLSVITKANTGIAQRVETLGGNFYAGKTYTVSALVNPSVEDLSIVITYRDGNTYKADIHVADVSSQLTSGQYKRISTTFTLANSPTDFAGTNCIQISFKSSVINTLNLKEVQLEEGSVASPFEHRPYGLELSLCQRYYEKSTYVGIATVYATNKSYAQTCPIGFKATKRSSPSMSFGSVANASNPILTTSSSVTSTLFKNAEAFTVYLGRTAGDYGYVNFTWTADAEL